MPDVQIKEWKDDSLEVDAEVGLQIYGSTGWTTAIPWNQHAITTITNLTGGALYIRRKTVAEGTDIDAETLVSPTVYTYTLADGEVDDFETAPGQSLCIYAAVSGFVYANSVYKINNAS